MQLTRNITTSEQERFRLENQHKSGANWFYWISGLSVINTLIVLFGARYSFLVGLGITQVVDGIVYALSSSLAPDMATVAKVVGFVVNLAIAGLFVVFGVLARKRYKWAFIVGMVLYALDAIIFAVVGDWWSFGFHLFALYGLYAGLRAQRRLAGMK